MLARRFGGAERFHVDLSAALAHRGHDVMTISQAGSEAAHRLAAQDNLRCETIRTLGPWDPFAPRTILRLVRDHGAQVIQTSLARAAHLAGPAAARLGIPLAAHVHNFIKMKYFRRVDAFVPTTTFQRDYLARQGVPADNVRRISNFSAFDPVAAPRCRDPVTRIAAAGRFVPKKGFDLLLRSFQRPAAAGVQLYLAGAGPERRRLVKLAAALGLAEKVHFVGWQDDMRRFLPAADLFVLPSREEPFGFVLLEAMAAGLPIVAARCHGPREILDEDSAWLCDADNEAALTAALEAALADPAQRRRRAQAALALFRQRYTVDKVVPQFERLYRECIARGGKRV